MISVAPTAPEPTAPPPAVLPEPAAPQAAAPARRRRSFWALGDQVLVSGANFITMVMTARALRKTEFGVFTQAYAILLLANLFQFALVVQAHNVLGSGRSGERYAAYTTATAISQLLLCAIQAAIVSTCAGVAFAAGWTWAPLALALAPAVCAWQLQEFVRRVLYTEGRHAAAFFNDCISYGGQGLAILWYWHRGTLHATTALYVLAATSLAAAAFGVWQMRASLTRRPDRTAFRENWEFGRWLLGGELLQYASSIQTYLFIAAYLLGASAAGELRAAQIIFGPTRIFSFYLGNVLPIRFAAALATEGEAAVRGTFRSILKQVVPPFAAYSLAIAIFAGPILQLMYGSEYAGQPWVLRAYTLVALLSYVQVVVVSLMTARRQTRTIFVAQLAGAVVGLGVGWLAILLLGVSGASLAMGLSISITMLYLHSKLRDGYASPNASPTSALDAAMAELEGGGPAPDPQAGRRGALLVSILGDLDKAGVRYCISHGHAALPERLSGDVDCIIDAAVDRATLARLLEGVRADDGVPARQIVQWFEDGARYIVVAERGGHEPATVALHLSTDYDLDGYRIFGGDEILKARVRRGELWVTPPAIEAACVAANRILKRDLRPRDRRRLGELFAIDAAGCGANLERLFGEADGRAIGDAARRGEWSPVSGRIESMRRSLRKQFGVRGTAAMLAARAGDWARRASRWAMPRNGFHVVFLGPDGVGKSTVIEGVREAVRPAFLRYSYQTFAPSLLPAKYTEKPSPHAKPPRSYPASLMKAAWWTFCYGPLYFTAVRPTLARAGLVINHRYLLDAIVDKKRYRYSGPTWLLKMIWAISPKPDLVVLLDAPADVIQARKKEMPFEETARQCAAYRELVGSLSNGVRIDANRPINDVVASVNSTIFALLNRRAAGNA